MPFALSLIRRLRLLAWSLPLLGLLATGAAAQGYYGGYYPQPRYYDNGSPYGDYGRRAPPPAYGRPPSYGQDGYRQDHYRERRPSAYGRGRARLEPPPQQPSSSLFPWFRPFSSEPAEPDPRLQPPAQPQRPVQRRVKPKPKRPPASRPAEIRKKPDPAHVVAVFGDGLADLLAQGLDRSFADEPEIAILRQAKAETGPAAVPASAILKSAQDALAGTQKISFAVVMPGLSEAGPIREGETMIEPLSDRWRALRRERTDVLLRVFADKKVPVVWVGAPPVKDEALSPILVAANEIDRDRVQKAGGTYVDIWDAFVDEENHYAAWGPSMEGHRARLRFNDGIRFTQIGARKAAHFAALQLKHLIEGGAPAAPAIVTPPTEATPEAAVPDSGAPAEPAKPAPKPVAGPVLPLTRPDLAPDGKLIGGPIPAGDAAQIADRALRAGTAPPPQPGRADDFRWPSP